MLSSHVIIPMSADNLRNYLAQHGVEAWQWAELGARSTHSGRFTVLPVLPLLCSSLEQEAIDAIAGLLEG